jgi:hypothetical protein
MSFTILYRASVKREMRRLDAVMVKRIDAAILALAGNPRVHRDASDYRGNPIYGASA